MNQLKKVLKLSLFGLAISLLSFFKLSFIIGSKTMCFSGINFILPLICAFFNLPVSMLLICFTLIFKAFLGFGVLTLGLPTMVAALSWSKKVHAHKLINFSLNILLPTLCIILFVTHSVAGKAAAYSFYWFIPVVIYFLNSRSIFLTALSSTFLAHAVGSIIWLYSIPMTCEQWNALIPVVAAERLIMACAMTLAFRALKIRTGTQAQGLYDTQYQHQVCKVLDHNHPEQASQVY